MGIINKGGINMTQKEYEKINEFGNELEKLINKHSIDSMVNMPDFKIANILIDRIIDIAKL